MGREVEMERVLLFMEEAAAAPWRLFKAEVVLRRPADLN